MSKDPICGMTVDEATALPAEREGETFYFCSEHCRSKFLAQSETQNGKDRSGCHDKTHEPHNHARTIYTCPMHPEIEQDHPGDCPKCGMALEPKTVSGNGEEHDNAELRDMTQRFWVGAVLAMPVFLLAMAHLLPRFLG
jgi:Cu+-exporting ATPase